MKPFRTISRIVVNGRFLTRRPTGVDRFAIELLRALDRARADAGVEGPEIEILVPRAPQVETGWRTMRMRVVGPFDGHAWEQLTLPMAARGATLLSLCNTGPVWGRDRAVVIHDAAVLRHPENFTPAFRLLYRVLMPLQAHGGARVMTVSRFAAGEMAAWFGGAVDRYPVLGEGTEHVHHVAADASILARHGLRQGGYFLAVGSRAANKNIALIRDTIAHTALPMPFVIAGGSRPQVFAGPAARADRPKGGILETGYVDDAQLRALYENACAFVFPSRYEGFGLPPVEAMRCGCPVVAARCASLPEVCGDAALYVEPDDPVMLGDVLRRLADDPALRDAMRARGLRRADALTWSNAAARLGEALGLLAVDTAHRPAMPVAATPILRG